MTAHRVLPQSEVDRRRQTLSDRHRRWGVNVPATDIDYFVEYDLHEPKALVEYKDASTSRPTDSGTEVLGRLGRMAGIPVFLALYDPATWTFTVRRLDGPSGWATMTEDEWVAFLHQLRGRQP